MAYSNKHTVSFGVFVCVCECVCVKSKSLIFVWNQRQEEATRPTKVISVLAYGKPNTWLILLPERAKWKKGRDRDKKTSWWASGKCSEDRKTSLKCYWKKKMALLIGLKHLCIAEVEWPRVIWARAGHWSLMSPSDFLSNRQSVELLSPGRFFNRPLRWSWTLSLLAIGSVVF